MQFFLKPSKCFYLLIMILYLGAALCLLITAMPIYLHIIAISFYLIGLELIIRKLFWFDNKIIGLFVDNAGDWYLLTAKGVSQPISIKANSYVSTVLVILNFKLKQQWQSHSLILFADALVNKDSFRQLRRCLLTQ